MFKALCHSIKSHCPWQWNIGPGCKWNCGSRCQFWQCMRVGSRVPSCFHSEIWFLDLLKSWGLAMVSVCLFQSLAFFSDGGSGFSTDKCMVWLNLHGKSKDEYTVCPEHACRCYAVPLNTLWIIANSVVSQGLTRIGSIVVSYILLSLASLGLLFVGSLVSYDTVQTMFMAFLSEFW